MGFNDSRGKLLKTIFDVKPWTIESSSSLFVFVEILPCIEQSMFIRFVAIT